jgi:hypothetical protein
MLVYHDVTAGTEEVRLYRTLAEFTASNAKFREEARAAAIAKHERCMESQRIAAEFGPRKAPAHKPAREAGARSFLPIRQPPGRFAYYQGAF